MGKKHQEGFTLIELLMLMMVLALTLGVGVPAFGHLRANSRMTATGNDLMSSLHAARTEATTRNRPVTLCASATVDAERPSCDAGSALLDGWIVFADDNASGTVDADETVIQAHGPVAPTITGAAGTAVDAGPPEYLSFRGDGFLLDIDALGPAVRHIQLCDERGNHDTGNGRSAGRWISIAPAGRPALVSTTDRLQGPANPLGGC